MTQLRSRFFILLVLITLTTALTAQPPSENVDPGGGGAGGSTCLKCYVRQSGNMIIMIPATARPQANGASAIAGSSRTRKKHIASSMEMTAVSTERRGRTQ